MSSREGATLGPLLLLTAYVSAACGARTSLETEEPSADAANAAPTDSTLVDFVDAPTFVDGGRPAVAKNPFRPGDHWVGTYTCPQGLTQLDLQIGSTSANDITDAIFGFDFAPGAVTGSFHLRGVFDPEALTAVFVAGSWIVRPHGWLTVGMQGTVALSTMTYAGRITYPACRSFSVTRTL